MLYELIWLPNTANMSEDDYKIAMLSDQNKLFNNYDVVNFLLLDNRDFLMTMSPELQEWSAKEITSEVMEANPQLKIALVVSQDIFSRVSVSQAVEEDETMDRVTHYFENKEEAYDWILSHHKKHNFS
ncbi:hypothetical protein M23134_03494 [Microscilla marina ATCC 23134]|uniref:STAS/SEC14 domain-containing protein n=2 Tax=Microscilla marina TaxID=1027 RepID=A1ZN52_MICM2|nr:hypothetical protein M23134_03494 [Microscilla marina ATCC 23134]